jgi:UDP-2-acetamido-2,6-beta-L-arabino-hexul-4-ose reductase
MDAPLITIVTVPDTGDERGCSFQLPDVWNRFLSAIADMHVTTVRPGQRRGNHYHARHKEVLIVIHRDVWSFHWDHGAGTEVQKKSFAGAGAVVIEVSPLASHAVLNEGTHDIFVAGLSDSRYNPDHPDAYPRPVV